VGRGLSRLGGRQRPDGSAARNGVRLLDSPNVSRREAARRPLRLRGYGARSPIKLYVNVGGGRRESRRCPKTDRPHPPPGLTFRLAARTTRIAGVIHVLAERRIPCFAARRREAGAPFSTSALRWRIRRNPARVSSSSSTVQSVRSGRLRAPRAAGQLLRLDDWI